MTWTVPLVDVSVLLWVKAWNVHGWFPPERNLFGGFYCYDYINSNIDVKRLVVVMVGGQETKKFFNWKHKDTDFYRCETTMDAKFEGSGLKVQEMWFFLCWASTMSAQGFPCWLRSWGHPYWRFSIVVSPQTYPASRESVVCVYGDDETPSCVLPRLG